MADIESKIRRALLIVRGLPGSGKSTLCKLLSQNGRWPVFAIDDYFTDPKTGAYHFEFENNYKAYSSCEQRTRKALEVGVELVLVDNTFVLDWEMEPYLKMASEFGYELHVVTAEKFHDGENSHGISQDQIEKMGMKYKVKLF
jgi:predicted kinase